MHIRKLLIIFACALFVASAVLSAHSPNADTLESKITGESLHPVWIIESAQNRVYLLGSIHMLREKDYPLPEVFYDAFRDAERLVMEIDVTSIAPIDVFRITRELAMLPEKQTLESYIGASEYLEIARRAEKIGINLDQFSKVDPWYAAMTITQIQMGRMGFSAEKGIELHFAELAREKGKPISGLETLSQQLGFLDDLAPQTQSEFLLESMLSEAELLETGEATLAAWKRGDLKELTEILGDGLEENSELRNVLLTQRNLRWLPQIEKMTLEKDDYLVIVGALHLDGKDGLIGLLREAGFTLRQL